MIFPGKNLSTVNLGLAFSPTSLPKYHWIADPPDLRDHVYKLAPMGSLPTSVDLRSYASPIDDQGNLGSCTGNAIAGAIDLIDQKNNKRIRVSRLFVYYQERVLEHNVYYDAGAYIRDGIKACYTWGAPLESLWPYNINKWATTPSTAAYTDALTRKIVSYAKCANFTAVKNAIASGTPVVIGFTVYDSFEGPQCTTTGVMPYPNVNREQILGGHAVCIVGYSDNFRSTGQGYFIVRNSWGTSWGDGGYFYMPYAVLTNTNMSSDFWTISGVHNP